jgi:hypothetical protein
MAANSRVVAELACLSKLLGISGMLRAPLESVDRVVETVDVVMVKSGADVVGGLRNLGRLAGGRVGLGGRSGIGLRGGRRGRRGCSGLNDRRRRGRGRSGCGSRLRGGFGGGLGGGLRSLLDDDFGAGRRRRRRGGRRGRGGNRRSRGLGGARARATEGGGNSTLGDCDGDPFDNDIRLYVEFAALENRAGGAEEGAARGEEGGRLHGEKKLCC